jgi:gluconolactonase
MNRPLIRTGLLVLALTSAAAQAAPAPQMDIPGVIRASAKVELVKDGLKGLEGPVPSGDGGLYFSAIEENRIYKLDRDGRTITVFRENTNARTVSSCSRMAVCSAPKAAASGSSRWHRTGP